MTTPANERQIKEAFIDGYTSAMDSGRRMPRLTIEAEAERVWTEENETDAEERA